MGKYNLGKSTTKVKDNINSAGIYINETKATPIVDSISGELDDISNSLNKINNILNRSVSIGAIKGARGNTFKSWAKKSKAQATNASKIKDKLDKTFAIDVKEYPIRLLDARIAELERKLASMSE